MKTKIIAIGIFLILFITMALINVYNARPEYKREKAEAKSYYSKYAIRLKGIVIDKQRVTSDLLTDNYFIYTIKVLDSNVAEHDVRSYLENYYVLIKNDTAKFVSHSILGAEVRDSILIDYAREIQYIRRGAEKPSKRDLPVFDLHYNRMRQQAFGF